MPPATMSSARAASGGPYTTIATGVTATNYTDTVPVGMKYYYVVSAVVGGVESLNSSEATVESALSVDDAGRGRGGSHGQRELTATACLR